MKKKNLTKEGPWGGGRGGESAIVFLCVSVWNAEIVIFYARVLFFCDKVTDEVFNLSHI